MPEVVASAPAATSQPAAAPGVAPGDPSAPPTVSNDGKAADSGAAADPAKGAPPAETKEQKQARISNAAKGARRAAARNRELIATNARLQQHAHLVTQTAQTQEQQVSRLRELARTDPLSLARELGLDPKKVVEASLKDGSPEAQLEARIAAAEAKAAAAEERARKWEEGQQTAQQEAQQRELTKQAHTAFVTESGNEKAFPTVAKMPAPARIAWAQQLLAEDRARAAQTLSPEQLRHYHPTNTQLLQHMEKLAASNGAPPKANPTDASPDETQAGSKPPSTVTNAITSAKYTLPANFDSLSDADQKHHLARYLEALGGGKRKKNA
jgi:hypothetical protein